MQKQKSLSDPGKEPGNAVDCFTSQSSRLLSNAIKLYNCLNIMLIYTMKIFLNPFTRISRQVFPFFIYLILPKNVHDSLKLSNDELHLYVKRSCQVAIRC